MPDVPVTPEETLRATHDRALAVASRASQDAAVLPPGPLADAARRLEVAARSVVLLTQSSTKATGPSPD